MTVQHIKKDERGYGRYVDSGRLVHRSVAYKEIYLKNRDKYPGRFSEYVVHHKDGDKTNNMANNLEITTKKDHFNKHLVSDKLIEQHPSYSHSFSSSSSHKSSPQKYANSKTKYLATQLKPSEYECVECLRIIKHKGLCKRCEQKNAEYLKRKADYHAKKKVKNKVKKRNSHRKSHSKKKIYSHNKKPNKRKKAYNKGWQKPKSSKKESKKLSKIFKFLSWLKRHKISSCILTFITGTIIFIALLVLSAFFSQSTGLNFQRKIIPLFFSFIPWFLLFSIICGVALIVLIINWVYKKSRCVSSGAPSKVWSWLKRHKIISCILAYITVTLLLAALQLLVSFFSPSASMALQRKITPLFFIFAAVFGITFMVLVVKWFYNSVGRVAQKCPKCKKLGALHWQDEFVQTAGTVVQNGQVKVVNMYRRHEWCDSCGYQGTRMVKHFD